MILTESIIKEFQKKSRVSPIYMQLYIGRSNNDALLFAKELISDGHINNDSAGRILGNTIDKAYINLNTSLFHDEIVELLPQELAIKYEAIPLYKLGSTITVAMSEPDNYSKISAISTFLDEPVDAIFSLPDDIRTAIKLRYRNANEIHGVLSQITLSSIDKLLDSQLAELQPIIEISNTILLLALKEHASDIHIEAKDKEYVIRYRVDGCLKEVMRIEKKIGISLVSRYKVMSKLDITNKRIPQDGKFSVNLPNTKFDVRVSTLPATHGEKIVLRILGGTVFGSELNLANLSLSNEVYDAFSESLKEPNGIIFVTGPTGSGKSTTLYSGLNHIDSEVLNITTIEDPVEYTLPTITQTQVNVKAGSSFPTILRACLRQDPDVILVGEIRDAETAKIATEAALTGHLVLSTLHTNNALQAITRLIEIGVDAHVVAPAMIGVLAQRLVRKICTNCKTSYTPDTELLRKYFFWEEGFEYPAFYKGKGCKQCNSTGYKGRVGIHEFLRVKSWLRDMILKGSTHNEIMIEAELRGFTNMRYDGFLKALNGLTTLEEVIHATSSN